MLSNSASLSSLPKISAKPSNNDFNEMLSSLFNAIRKTYLTVWVPQEIPEGLKRTAILLFRALDSKA